ncbi:MAG: metal ABC transporter ATP-binding protein [Verrucomicrobiae bacterium]|nr:metal ABC transporter ATP-binding protein [Verrucomicrobiae bacterium]
MSRNLTDKTVVDEKTAIEVENLTIRFGERVILDNISLKIVSGDFVALIGPNGSGKTTLLKAILGTVSPDKGIIKIFGREPISAVKIGYIPQKLSFEKSLAVSVREFLSLGLRETRGWFWQSHRNLDREFGDTVERLGLTHLLDAPICKLSGGELQKTLITFSLLEKPDLLLMDEATEGVDMTTENIIYEVIASERKSRNMTVVMVSHDLAMVSREATRVIAIGNGKVCCEGIPNEVLTDESLRNAYGIHFTPYCHHH